MATGVGVTLTRAKQVKPDLLTQARFTRLDAVRAVYGAAVSKNVAPFAAASDTWDPSGHAAPPPPPPAPEEPTFSAEGLVSTGNAAVKKTSLVLFINGRPAECAPLKAALDSTYATLHSKAACYWAFVDVKVPPAHVDVNIHPTKSEVALLFQPEIIEAVRGAVDAVLAGCHGVRTFARADRAGAQAIPGASPAALPPAASGGRTPARRCSSKLAAARRRWTLDACCVRVSAATMPRDEEGRPRMQTH